MSQIKIVFNTRKCLFTSVHVCNCVCACGACAASFTQQPGLTSFMSCGGGRGRAWKVSRAEKGGGHGSQGLPVRHGWPAHLPRGRTLDHRAVGNVARPLHGPPGDRWHAPGPASCSPSHTNFPYTHPKKTNFIIKISSLKKTILWKHHQTFPSWYTD